MEEFLKQLPDEDQRFADEWPNIIETIRREPLSNDLSSILKELINYVRKSSQKNCDSHLRSVLFSTLIDRLAQNDVQIETNDLVLQWINFFEHCECDELSAEFICKFYTGFEIGKRLNNEVSRENSIRQIFLCIQRKQFGDDNRKFLEKLNKFLNQNLFSDSPEKENILNNQLNLQSNPVVFQEFFKDIARRSMGSILFLNLCKTLNDSSRSIFSAEIFTSELRAHEQVNIDDISPDYVQCLIRMLGKDSVSIRVEGEHFLSFLEKLLKAKRFHDAHDFLSKIILPNLANFNVETLLKTLIETIPKIEEKEDLLEHILPWCIPQLSEVTMNKELARLVLNLSKTILNLYHKKAPGLAYSLLTKRDFFSWKDLVEDLIEFYQISTRYDSLIDDDYFSSIDELQNFIELIQKTSQTQIVIRRKIHPIVCETVLNWCRHGERQLSPFVFSFASKSLVLIDLEQVDEKLCLDIVDVFMENIDQEVFPPKQHLIMEIIRSFSEFIRKLSQFTGNFHRRIIELFSKILDLPFYNDKSDMTLGYIIFLSSFIPIGMSINNENDLRLYIPCLNKMFHRSLAEEFDVLFTWWSTFWLIVGQKFVNVAAENLDLFINFTVDQKRFEMITLLLHIAMSHSDRVMIYFDDLFQASLLNNAENLFSFNNLITILIKMHPERIESKHVDLFFSQLTTIRFDQTLVFLVQSFGSVTSLNPDLFVQHENQILIFLQQNQHSSLFEFFGKYLVASTIIHGEEKARQSIDLIVQFFNEIPSTQVEIRKQLMSICLQIGVKYRGILVERRNDWCRNDLSLLVHFADDTIVSEIDQVEVTRALFEFQSIEQILMKNSKLSTKVTLGKMDDRSILPAWASKVSKMLNRRIDESDWKKLGKQLGYHSNEIYYFSMHHDPCLALLNDWFETHSSEEATTSLLIALNQIDRIDAEQIIRQYFKTTDNPDYKVQRYASIFLSFHKNRRTQCFQLQIQLKQAGFASQQIDDGVDVNNLESYICGAKLILCCIDSDYEKSETCRNQLNVAVRLRKSILFLDIKSRINSIDQSIQTIVAKHPHIVFFISEKNNDWLEDNFIELLARIRFYLSPNPDIIEERYRNWYVAHFDHLVFLKHFQAENSEEIQQLKRVPLLVLQAQLVLLYPWKYQKDALILYEKLTNLGYRVWIDLFQMSSWQTLEENMTCTMNNCSCILTCLSSDYLESTIGKRELLMAKKSKKKLLALLFEPIQQSSWTQLTTELVLKEPAIDLTSVENGSRYSGKSFQVLLINLKRILPRFDTDKPRHLLEMQRPQSATIDLEIVQRSKNRISSASSIPQSRACSLM